MQSSIIEKSLALLDAIGAAGRPLSFSEVVDLSGFNKSTVHRLLANLTAEGMVHYDDQNRSYLLGPRLLQLAKRAWQGFDIQAVAFPEMLRLHEQVSENVSIGVLQDQEVVHLRMVESQYHWGITPVMREPAHTTATGKAIVAFLPEETLSAWLARYDFFSATKRSITARHRFEKELAKVRKSGLACADREQIDYVVGIAAPIFNFVQQPVAALNIWGPTNRCSLADLMAWEDALKNSARRISTLIGNSEEA